MQVFMRSFFVLKRSSTVMDFSLDFSCSSSFWCLFKRFVSIDTGTSLPFHFANDLITLKNWKRDSYFLSAQTTTVILSFKMFAVYIIIWSWSCMNTFGWTNYYVLKVKKSLIPLRLSQFLFWQKPSNRFWWCPCICVE